MFVCLFSRKSSSGYRWNRRRRRKNRICGITNHDQLCNISRIEILPNASKFAIYSAIRAIVMESESKSQTLFDIFENSKKLKCHTLNKTQDIETDAESLVGEATEKQITQPLSQVNKLGLTSMFVPHAK